MIGPFRDEYRFLSNFYPSPLEYRHWQCRTAEHAYQASKALSILDRKRILAAPTPGEAKRLGAKIRISDTWRGSRTPTMRAIIRAKFYQNEDLKGKLIATGGEELVEVNYWRDTFWGVCNGKGQNLLGKILMEVREQIKRDS